MMNLPADTPGSATDTVVSRAAGTGPATWAMGMLFERLAGAEETAGLLGASVVTQPPGQARPRAVMPGRERPHERHLDRHRA